MKKILLIAAVVAIFFGCDKTNQFKIKGEIVPSQEGSLILYAYSDSGLVSTDTSLIKEGKFEFKGEIELPDVRLIGVAGQQQQFIAQMFVEKGKINMTIYPDSFEANVVTGSKSQDIFKKYLDEVASFSTKDQELRQRFIQAQMTGNEDEMNAVRFEFETISKNVQLYSKNFISEYKNSPVAAYIYLMNFFESATTEEMDSILTVFDPSIKESQFVKVISKQAESARKTAIGAVAPDFSLNDPAGNKVSLSSLKGKVVLIDFWASWCQPCMVEMPNVIAQYAAFKDKGFEIYGVSLDREKMPGWKPLPAHK
jgi:hypothetical protein